VLQVGEHGGVAAQCARSKQGIIGRQDQVAAAANLDQRSRSGRLQMLVVAGEKLEAVAGCSLGRGAESRLELRTGRRD